MMLMVNECAWAYSDSTDIPIKDTLQEQYASDTSEIAIQTHVPQIVYDYYDPCNSPIAICLMGGEKKSKDGFIKNLQVQYISKNVLWNDRYYDIISPTKKYRKILPFSEGLAAVSSKIIFGHEYIEWGFINEKRNLVIPCKYEKARSFHEGLAAVYKCLKGTEKDLKNNPGGCRGWVYVNDKGEEIISDTYEVASDFSDGMAIVVKFFNRENPHHGPTGFHVINKKGEILDSKMINNRGDDFFIYGSICQWTNNGDSILKIDDNGKLQLIKNPEPKHIEYGDFRKKAIIGGKKFLPGYGGFGVYDELNGSTTHVNLKNIPFYLGDMNVYGDKSYLLSLAKEKESFSLCLASKYYLGDSRYQINQSYKKSFDYFKYSAKEFNSLEAQFMLGWMYEHAQGVEKNETLAQYWYDKSKRKRIALIIGNWDYPDFKKPLESPRYDIEGMYNTLIRIGFEKPIVARNACKQAMEDSIKAFMEKAKTADVALVYYSGHGLQFKNKNYLLPNDYKHIKLRKRKEIERKLEETCVVGQDVMTLMDSLECGNKFLILDACRDHGFGGRKGSETEKFVKMQSKNRNGTCVVFATAEGTSAYEGGNKENSIFTKALLDGLNNPRMLFKDLYVFIKKQVEEESLDNIDELQTPEVYNMKSVENFIFNKGK